MLIFVGDYVGLFSRLKDMAEMGPDTADFEKLEYGPESIMLVFLLL